MSDEVLMDTVKIRTSETMADVADTNEYAIRIKDVGMSFNMANEQLNSLKEYFIKIARHELFFKEFVALDNITIDIRKGDVCGIIGTNGSGKSTLLKIIAGVLEPTKGSCKTQGNIAPLIELGAGFDFELTARENIYLNGALLGYGKSFIKKHFDEIVNFAELEEFLELPLKNYSSGMVARIAFAIATVIIPDILIIDETLSVGDMFFQKKCEAKIKSLINEHETTTLFVSHDISQVERICKRAVWLDKGIKRMEDSAEKVCEAYRQSH
jgi:ABC-2 type transport system ATP-binding protein